MTSTTFLLLLSAFSVVSSLITEGVKKLLSDETNMSYNILALVVALIVGVVGSGVYYQLNDIAFSVNNTIYMVLMGFASGLVSMVGFDKVKQTIEQITHKEE